MPRSGTAWSYDNSIFSFLGTFIVFSTVGTYVPINSVGEFPFHHILSSIYYCRLLMMAILTGWRWYLIVALVCISIINSDVEYFFMCLLTVCISSVEKYILRSSAHFSVGMLVFFLLLVCMNYLYILELFVYLYIKPLSVASYTNIFFHSGGCVFMLLWVPLLCKSL